MNLVGHVAVALEPGREDPSTQFLVGCMLPDLAAIARVRLARPTGDTGRGVEFHHACDAVFHESAWFHAANRGLRDALLEAGVDTGPARACSHAGVEMLLDGALVDDARVLDVARRTLDAVARHAGELASLAPVQARADVAERLERIGTSLDPTRYADPHFVAERLHGMTTGRRRIELPAAQVGVVARELHTTRRVVTAGASDVISGVRGMSPHLRHA